MISAPNLLRPLSGSKLWFPLIIGFLLIGCAGSKSGVNDRPTVVNSNIDRSEETSELENVISVDTIQWSFRSIEDIRPITSDMGAEEVLPFEQINEENYSVALMMPFRLTGNQIDDLNGYNEKFAHFYAGYKMSVEDEGWIATTTYHTNRSSGQIDSLLGSLSSETDLIIGPFDKGNITKVSEFAKRNRIAAISPWNASTSVTSDNLFYLQLRPNLSSYWESIIQDATKNFDRSKIRVIRNADGSDRSMMNFIQKINEEKSGLPISEPLGEYPVSIDSLLYGDSLVFKLAFDEQVEAFIIPHYSSSNHDRFIYECLRKINAEKEGASPQIYVMPVAVKSKRLDLNILNNLDLKICDYRFYDKRDADYQSFKSEFYSRYGRLPSDDAYYGYDIGRLIIYGFMNYGKYFHYYMKDEKVSLNQMSIKVRPYYNSSDELLYLMNEHLDIYQFEEGYYRLKNTD